MMATVVVMVTLATVLVWAVRAIGGRMLLAEARATARVSGRRRVRRGSILPTFLQQPVEDCRQTERKYYRQHRRQGNI
ncbi:MAG: hypothetical protein WBG64_16740, partial [Thermoanaerobaculia bacterium]